MSMKSFPNKERFWQYSWTLFSYVVQLHNGGEVPCPSHRQPPILCEPHVGKLSSLEGACDRTSSICDGNDILIQSRKSLAEAR